MDAVIHFFFRDLILSLLDGTLSPIQMTRAIEQAIRDCGIETIRRCWLVLDNHDTKRLSSCLPDIRMRKMARLLQFTLPGCPQLYYGNEIDMPGGNDPENRAPMPWNRLERESDPFLRKLIALYRETPALRWGDCRFYVANRLLAFARGTEHLEHQRMLVLNPSSETVEETVVIPDHRVSHHGWTEDVLSGERHQILTASLRIRLEPFAFRVLKPVLNSGEYFPYRRL